MQRLKLLNNYQTDTHLLYLDRDTFKRMMGPI